MQRNYKPYTELDMMKFRAGWPVLSIPVPNELPGPADPRATHRLRMYCAASARRLRALAAILESFAAPRPSG